MIAYDQNRSDGLSKVIAIAEQVRGLCSVVTKVARADLEAHLKQHNSGITAIEHGVLRHLSRGVTSMAEISRLMGVAPSTLVYVVDGLTQRKLVKRSQDPKDRRKEPLVLEKKGARLFADSPKMASSSLLVRCLDGMPAPHRKELVALLTELVKGLRGSERLYLDELSAVSATPSTARSRKQKAKEAKS